MAFTGYVGQADLERRLSPQKVAQLYDKGDGTLDSAALTANAVEASRLFDADVARAYKGNGTPLAFPLAVDPTTGDYPSLVKSGALYYLMAMSVERHPEYARMYGDNGAIASWRKEAKLLGEQVAGGDKIITEPTPAKGNMRKGGVVSTGATTMVSGNGGDWNV